MAENVARQIRILSLNSPFNKNNQPDRKEMCNLLWTCIYIPANKWRVSVLSIMKVRLWWEPIMLNQSLLEQTHRADKMQA